MPSPEFTLRRPVAGVSLLLAAALALACGGTPAENSPPDRPNGDAGTAKVALESLTVARHRPMSRYSRDRFPHWRKAGANCDVRDTVLARDGKNVEKDGCNVTGGEWFSVYDSKTVNDPSEIDIDHMVPLAASWRAGADSWTDDKRSDFANDLDRPQLIAVSRSSNRSKGDQDPSQWKPPNEDFWCQYAQDWIAVKSHWRLTVTADEKVALAEMLETCV